MEIQTQEVNGGEPLEYGPQQPEMSHSVFANVIEKLNYLGQVIIEKLPGNGGREVAIFVPPGVDRSNAKLILHFHGTHSQDLRLAVAGERLASSVKAAGDAILVYPLSAGYRGSKGGNNSAARNDYDDRWMADKGDDPQQLYADVLQRLPGVNVTSVLVEGHSAGGEALANLSDRFNPGEGVQYTMRFLDASYGHWARDARANLDKVRMDAKMEVFVIPNTDTTKYLADVLHQPGVAVYKVLNTTHGGMIEKAAQIVQEQRRSVVANKAPKSGGEV